MWITSALISQVRPSRPLYLWHIQHPAGIPLPAFSCYSLSLFVLNLILYFYLLQKKKYLLLIVFPVNVNFFVDYPRQERKQIKLYVFRCRASLKLTSSLYSFCPSVISLLGQNFNHGLVHFFRLAAPNTKYVGAMHIKEAKPLLPR